MIPVPDRFKDPVGKTQEKDILYRFLAQIVIDPVDLIFPEKNFQCFIQRMKTVQIQTEGFFKDCQTFSPSVRIFCQESIPGKIPDRFCIKGGGQCQIENP